MNDMILGELQRLLANMIRVGKVIELDESGPFVRVQIGELTSAWLRCGAQRAGETRQTWMPSVGEQVVVLAPFGDTAQGFVAFSLNQDAHEPVSSNKDIHATEFPDGTRLEYNSQNNTYTMTVAGDSKVVVNCKEATVNAQTKVTLNTPDTFCTGKLTVDGQIFGKSGAALTGGSVTHNGKNIGATHTHGGVQSGIASTAAPN